MNIKNIKIYKIAIITIFLIGLMFIVNEVFAADLAIKVNGNTVTVSSQYIGRVNLSANGATLSANSVWLENSSENVTVTVTDKTKGATITATPNYNNKNKMSDSEGNLIDVGAKSVTIQGVKNEQPTQNQQPTQQQNQQPAQPAQQEEPNFTNTNKTMYTTGKINLRSSWSTSSAATPVAAGTEVKVIATSTNKVNGYVWYKVSYNGQTKYVASGLLTANKPAEEQQKEEKQEEKKEEKSTNKALKDLVIENYKLTPEFSPEVTKYSLEVKGDVDKLEITPVLQDEKSKFAIEGNESLKVGNNIVKVTVTAEDGTTRIYTIAVAKTNEDGADVEMIRLKDLKVNNLNLQPSFSPETTNYVIEMDDPSTFKISDIVATPEDETVDVSISEAVNTDKSEKIITIMLENKEGNKTGVYQITVKKASSNPIDAIKNNKDNKIYYILGGIIAVLLVLIVIVIILLKKTSNSDDYDGYEANTDELSDDYDYSLKNAIDEANNKPQQQYDEIVENSNVKSQILNSTPKDYDVFKDNDSFDETQVYDNFDSDIKDKKKGKHF